jgi:ABC-type oligopeptide transport system ATPase subunit
MPKKTITSNNMINWYDKARNFCTEYHNPSYANCGIKHCFRGLIIGGSGSGKSTLLVETIYRLQDTFGTIIVCLQNKDEPLYQYLKSKVKDNLIFHEGYKNIPKLEEIADKYKDQQVLVVFDDFVVEGKKQPAVEEYFIRSRKLCKGVSCIYLSQSYFDTSKLIRVQCNWIMLKKLSSMRDLKLILNDHNLGIDREELLKLYQYATENQPDFLMVDIDAPAKKRFRKNYFEILGVDGADEEI